MNKINDLLGFKVVHNKEEKIYKILNFPHFPQETIQSMRVYQEIEKENFMKRDLCFPIKFNITERITEIEYENIELFTLKDLFDVIDRDKNRFINTNTFFKVNLVYENKLSVLSIIYYTICDEGYTTIQNIDDLLNFVFINYNKKKFKKKFIKNRIKKNEELPNEIEYIPLIPLLWLDYDENNNLTYFNHFQLIGDDRNQPF